MPKGQPRKSKGEVEAGIKLVQSVQRTKVLARMIYPYLEGLDTVYDAQTAVNAASGHIKYGLVKAEDKLKISDLEMDLKTGKDSAVKQAVIHILTMFEHEPASEIQKVLELMGNKFPEHVATVGLKQPMASIPMNDFIAE